MATVREGDGVRERGWDRTKTEKNQEHVKSLVSGNQGRVDKKFYAWSMKARAQAG